MFSLALSRVMRRLDALHATDQSSAAETTPEGVVQFWLQAGPSKWFAHDPAFDDQIRQRFQALHLTASSGALEPWAGSTSGALALLILLDQFPRNLYRGSAHAFATDPMARSIAREAVERGFDLEIEDLLRAFFYLPFMHSELIQDQDRSLALCEGLVQAQGDKRTLRSAIQHRDIIVRFGRFPHRNGVLGRATSTEEQAFLDGGGFAGSSTGRKLRGA